VLTQGLNRQIRRMCRALDYHVMNLKRVRIMNIRLGNLERGKYRELTETELKDLRKMLRDSTNLPMSETKKSGERTKWTKK
jgi:23S rRNA pseudouridine2604 synthase